MIQDTYKNLKQELEQKKLIVFGCGIHFQRFCKTYISLLDKIEVILDNFCGKESVYLKEIDKSIPVVKPEQIKDWCMDRYVVLFCCKAGERRDAMEVQLDAIIPGGGIRSFSPLSMKDMTYLVSRI